MLPDGTTLKALPGNSQCCKECEKEHQEARKARSAAQDMKRKEKNELLHVQFSQNSFLANFCLQFHLDLQKQPNDTEKHRERKGIRYSTQSVDTSVVQLRGHQQRVLALFFEKITCKFN